MLRACARFSPQRACARFSPQRAEERLEEEMFINGYALKTRQCKCPIKFQIPLIDSQTISF